ncbi:mRNA capping enzyme, alpha subunit [Amniculicola lignicola CBS 123094]|uniref:mRNA-capping enzyme subunit alpha n=1 Tax=Amniculicola lignicola CBS 123094 TaxID=1392246 RepID=A0A6A5W7K6_9PLEO|nr:mRNA capping enzyme, alpha subunit [Amniculicola lignicola CBS 123094]
MLSSAPPQIPGQLLPNQASEYLRGQVANLLQRDNPRFPGAQPVSFARSHISELQRAEYFMSEKTDGIRCLLFMFFRDAGNGFEPVTFLIDRKNNYYELQPGLRFPYYQDPGNPEKFLFNTILDGELVHDRVPGQPKPRLVYYVFDCLVIDGQSYVHRPLDRRLGYMKEQVFKPYEAQFKNHPAPEIPFRIKEKISYPPYHVKHVFDNILPNLPHGNDGLIFTCKSTGYQFGTDKHILKWKPPHENTIDFKLKLGAFPTFDPHDGDDDGEIEDYDAMPSAMHLLVNHGNNKNSRFADLYFTEDDWEMFKGLNQRLDGRIIECYRDSEGRWRFKKDDDGTPRWRDDKKDANHISTVHSVLESIEDAVSEKDLMNAEARVKVAVKRLREEEMRIKQEQQMALEHAAKKRKFSGGPGADANGH